LSTVCALSILV